MRASEIHRYPVQSSAFQVDPLRERRRVVQQEFAAGPKPAPALDTTPFDSSPLRDFVAQARRDVASGLRPLGQLPESVKAIHTPAYSRGSYTMYEGEGLRVQVELGPLLWQHTQRGSGLGQLIDTFA